MVNMKKVKRFDFIMKPTIMRGWRIIKETKKSYLIGKKTSYYTPIESTYHLPKKNILQKIEIKE